MEQRLTIIKQNVGRTADKHIIGLYRCACGAEVRVAQSRVRNGYTKSCGCLAREESSRRAKTHGMKGSPEYRSWAAILNRCRNERSKDYPRYGGAGIDVCDEWAKSFEAFYSHVGPRPSGTTIDRINGAQGYEPGNVRWATNTEQARNKANFTIVSTPSGLMPLVDYAKSVGLTRGAAHLRLKRGKLEGVSRV